MDYDFDSALAQGETLREVADWLRIVSELYVREKRRGKINPDFDFNCISQ